MNLKNSLFLAQSDTTVGFLSRDNKKLAKAKNRESNKKFLQVTYSFKRLKSKVRVPKRFSRFIRYSKKSTFIYSNGEAFRVIFSSKFDYHIELLKKLDFCYSSSANLSGESFEREFALKTCDIIVFDREEFSEKTSSKIYKIYKKKLKRLR